MTVPQILLDLKKVKPTKPMSRWTLYQNLRALKIKPLGSRQCPQQYPPDTPIRIRIRLGLIEAPKPNGKRNGKSRH